MSAIQLAIADDDSRRSALAPRLRGATLVDSPDSAQAVAFLAAPPDRASVERYLQAGRHVLLSAGLPLADLDSLSETSRRSTAQLAVVNPDRYLPSRQLIKQQIPDKIGHVGLLRLHRWEHASADPFAGPPLRDLDTALWLVGEPPDRIYAVGRDRFVQVHLGFPGGGMALIDYDGRLPEGDGYSSLSVIAASGAAYADDHQNMQLLYRGGRAQAVRTEEGTRQHVAMIQAFVDGLHAGRDFSEDETAWRQIFAVADAVKNSTTTRMAVGLVGSDPL